MFRKLTSLASVAPLFLVALTAYSAHAQSAAPAPAPAPAPSTAGTTTSATAPATASARATDNSISPVAPAAQAPAAPAPAAPAAAAPAVMAGPPRAVTSPGEAVVHVAVNHRDAWLEMRTYVDGGDFHKVCRAPCDRKLPVEGREARVTAPGMTTSNVFRIDGGDGTAGVRVDGGSASTRRAGIIALAIGIPVALVGVGLFAQGRVKDSQGLTAAGVAGLSAGGLSIVVSLPLLLIGTTHVKNAKGSRIAQAVAHGALF